MKLRTKAAMEALIKQARQRIPFDLSFDGFCEGRCDECPEKLLEFLDTGLSDWEFKLKNGVIPSLGDVHSLAKDCKDVHDILCKKGLVREGLD